MSTLATSTVTTENSTTPLRLTTGNPSSGSVTLNHANSNITVQGSMIVGSGTISDSKGDLRDIPVNNQTTGYVLSASDIGKVVSTTSSVVIPANVFAAGDPITIFNNSLSTTFLLPASVEVTLYFAGTSLSGTRTMNARALCTILCVSPNVFVVTGVGIT